MSVWANSPVVRLARILLAAKVAELLAALAPLPSEPGQAQDCEARGHATRAVLGVSGRALRWGGSRGNAAHHVIATLRALDELEAARARLAAATRGPRGEIGVLVAVEHHLDVVLFMGPSCRVNLMAIQPVHHIIVRAFGIFSAWERSTRLGFPELLTICMDPRSCRCVTRAVVHLEYALFPFSGHLHGVVAMQVPETSIAVGHGFCWLINPVLPPMFDGHASSHDQNVLELQQITFIANHFNPFQC